jgi:hypothetical protein
MINTHNEFVICFAHPSEKGNELKYGQLSLIQITPSETHDSVFDLKEGITIYDNEAVLGALLIRENQLLIFKSSTKIEVYDLQEKKVLLNLENPTESINYNCV